MNRPNNPVLGHVTCAVCSQRATVHQQSRGKGRYLYTKGCECKAQQSAGATFQNDVWSRAEWLNGVEPIRPPNVTPEKADFDPRQPAIEPAPAVAQKPAQPAPALAAAGSAEPAAASKRGGVFAALAALAVGAVVLILTAGRAGA